MEEFAEPHSEEYLRSTLTGRRLLYVVNSLPFLISHRKLIVEQAVRLGARVLIAAPLDGGATSEVPTGVEVAHCNINPWSLNPLREMATLASIDAIYRRFQPSLAHHITIKPVIYGSLVCRLHPRVRFVNSVPGRGVMFSGVGVRNILKRALIVQLYRLALRNAHQQTIFQSQNDRDYFIGQGIVRREQCVLMPGAGIEIKRYYAPIRERHNPAKVLFAARLLKSKGVFEYLGAVKRLKADRSVAADCLLAGPLLPDHPDGIASEELLTLCKESGVRYIGNVTDMSELLKEVDITVIPSAYLEGVPRLLLEALCAGCAVVCREIPGITENFKPGIELLAYAEDGHAGEIRLESLLRSILKDPGMRLNIAAAGQRRILSESPFNAEAVANATLKVYCRLLSGRP